MLSTLFSIFAIAVFLGVTVFFIGRFPRPARLTATVLLTTWLIYIGFISRQGLLSRGEQMAPRMYLIFGPLLVYLVTLVRSNAVMSSIRQIPLATVAAFQGYRLFVELFLDELHSNGIVPKMLTFHGANFDILIGITGPLVAILFSKDVIGRKSLIAWNLLGLLTLINVASRAVMAMPGIRLVDTEITSLGIISFPFVYIPGFLAPLAVTSHLSSIRRLLKNH